MLKVKKIGVISDSDFQFEIIGHGLAIAGTHDPETGETKIDSVESIGRGRDVFVRVYRYVGQKTYVLQGRLEFGPVTSDGSKQSVPMPVALFDAAGVNVPYVDLFDIWTVVDPDFRVYKNEEMVYSWPIYGREDLGDEFIPEEED